MKLTESLNWRYSTKQYDKTRIVAKEDLNQIQEAIRLSSSAFGLQPFKVLIVENKQTREQLRSVSWNQAPVTDASHLLVFCSYADIKETDVDECIDMKASKLGISKDKLEDYSTFIKYYTANSVHDKKEWNSKQTYIAVSNLLTACAELKIDSTPLDGFSAAAYDVILNLGQSGLTTSAVVAIGYRSVEDKTVYSTRVRKPITHLFENI